MAVENTAWNPELRGERWFRTVFEHAATGIAITDLDGAFERCNPAYCALLGYTEDELRRVAFPSLVYPEDRKANLAEIRRLLVGEVPSFAIENRYVHKSGHPVWVRKWVSLLPDQAGKPAHIMALVTDMTDRRRAEQALRESEERLRLFVEHAPAALAMFDNQMRYLAVSRRWIADYLPGVGDPIGRNHYEVFPECPERWRAVHRRVLAGEVVRADEDAWERPDGAVLWARYEARPWRSDDGSVGGILIVTEDITDRKRAEQAVRESEERLRLMADALPALIAYVGADGRYQFNSAAYECWFGRPRDWYTGRHMREVLGEAAYAVLEPHVAAALAGQPRTFEARVPYLEAGTRDVLVHYVPHRDRDGRVVGFFNLVIDLTERKQAQEALRASEERLRLAVRAANVGLWDWDMRAHTVTYTPEWKAQLGYADEEIGNDQSEWVSRLHPDDRGPALDSVGRAIAGPDPVDEKEFRMRHKDGSWRWIYSRAEVIRDTAGDPVRMLGCHVDITDRKQAEETVRRSEERLRAILDTAADAIITINGEGTIQSVNPAAERMFGYTAAEMTGRNVGMLMPSPHREEHDRYLAEYLRTRVSRVIGVGREVEAVRKDGTLFPVELAVSEVDHLPLFTGILHDLTRRKELEREVVEVVSLEQRRIGQDLHDSVAQELTALNLLVDDLGDTLRADPASAALIERMAGGLRRSQEQLRAVLRGLVPVAVDVAGLMAALADLADRTGREGGPACSFDCPEPISVADNVVATQLYLIAQEAVRNAVKHARPRAVRITLESNGHLILRVRDDGIGLPARPTEIQGLGLRIMRDRAAIIGATLTIGPAEPTGTVVTCVLARRRDEQHADR